VTDPTITLQAVFPAGTIEVPSLVEAAGRAIREIPVEVAAEVSTSPAFWLSASKSVAGLVGSLLDVPLTDILVAAWKQHQRFREYADLDRYPPGYVSVVPLAEHHITSTHEPYIEVVVGGTPRGKIPFKATLDITVKSGNLVVEGGKIRRLEAGCARVTGTLECAGEVVAEHTSEEFVWSDGVSFGQGIPILAG